MQLFPFFLSRVGGDSFEQFTSQNSSNLNDLLHEFDTCERRISELKIVTSQCLFNHIRSLSESKQQNFLQNIRRDIFNDRKIKTEQVEKACQILPKEIAITLTQFIEAIETRSLKRSILQTAYFETRNEISEKLLKLSQNDSLQNGLIFSSQSFLERLQNIHLEKTRSKVSQTEKALLKYLSRIFTKTSPFSSFTNLSIGQIEQDVNDLIKCQSSSLPVESHLRINNVVLVLLKNKFLADPVFIKQLNIRVNPTLKKEKRRYKFLVNKNNQEIFKYLDRNQLIDLIHSVLGKQDITKTFFELSEELMEQVDSSREELDNYLMKLLSHGFIETNLSISGLHPDWDEKMVQLLQGLKINSDTTLNLATLINELIHGKANQSKFQIQERIEHFNTLTKKLDDYFEQKEAVTELLPVAEDDDLILRSVDVPQQTNQKQGNRLKKEIVFYEDTLRQNRFLMDKASINKIIEKLNSLLNLIGFLDSSTYEIERMTIYFKSRYKGKESIPVLKFYEDYYRDFKRLDELYYLLRSSDKNKADVVKQDPKYTKYLEIINNDKGRIERLQSIRLWRTLVEQKVSKLEWKDELNIDEQFIQDSLQGLDLRPPSKSAKNGSFGAFMQFFIHGEELNAVVNSVGPGFGRMLGRFLHLFDDIVTGSLRKWNRNADNNIILAECVDASVFNANIHPPLLDYEIWMPNSNNGLPVEKQISVNDLEFCYNKDSHELEIRDKKKLKQVYILDLGFQGELGRSKLYQMLTKFTLAPVYGTHSLVGVIQEGLRSKHKSELDGIVILPRIVFEDKIALSRKRWEVRIDRLPMKEKGEDDYKYFEKLNTWRISLGIPVEVFISINPHRRKNGVEAKITRDDYKPQYINFSWPQFANLFAVMTEKKPEHIWIEEMLPHSSEMLKMEGQRHVTEFVITWNK
jgi:hypothetical protein